MENRLSIRRQCEGDEGLEMYSSTTWANDGNHIKVNPALTALETYIKPLNNQILATHQLRCPKQGDMTQEFITKTQLLVDDAAVNDILRDTSLFGLRSDEVHKHV